MGKFLLFGAATEAGFTWLAVVGILNSVVSLAVYLRIVVPMYGQAKEAPASSLPVAVVWIAALAFTLGIGLAGAGVAGKPRVSAGMGGRAADGEDRDERRTFMYPAPAAMQG